MKEHPPYPWTAWDLKEFTGIEIWNHMSEWMEGLTEKNKYNYFMHPLKSIKAPPAETLRVWDKLNQKRKVVGIGGLDAHAHKVNLVGFFEVEVFPYKVLFKSIRTHILTDKKIKPSRIGKEIESAKKIVYSTLKKGRCFVSNYYHGDAAGFRFFAESGNKIYNMGDFLELSGKAKLRVILPTISGKIKLIRNGRLTDTVENIDADFIIRRKGSYRVEIYLNENAWIYSNHISIE